MCPKTLVWTRLLPLLPFQLTGAIVAGEAKGTMGPGGREMGQWWTRAKHPVPCLCFAHSTPDGY